MDVLQPGNAHKMNVLCTTIDASKYNLWFVSDTHFGHRRIVRNEPDHFEHTRPFDTTADMDAAIVDSWTKCVQPEDYVVFLGDFIMNCPRTDILSRFYSLWDKLPAKEVIFLTGNHDHILHSRMKSIPMYSGALIRYGERDFVCQHRPFDTCPWLLNDYIKHNGTDRMTLVHGHIHLSDIHYVMNDACNVNNVAWDNEYRMVNHSELTPAFR